MASARPHEHKAKCAGTGSLSRPWSQRAYATYEAWLEAGQQLATSESANRWALGDWARVRDPRWGDLAAAADAIGVSRTTLYHRVTVARRFPPDRRRADLSYSHHAEVVALPAEVADRLLADAAVEGWTVARLRAAAHEASVEGENTRLRTRVRELEAVLARPATARPYRQDATRTERACRDGWRQAERALDEALVAIAAQVAHPGRDAAHGGHRPGADARGHRPAARRGPSGGGRAGGCHGVDGAALGPAGRADPRDDRPGDRD